LPFRLYAAYLSIMAVTLALVLPAKGFGKMRVMPAIGVGGLALVLIFMTGAFAQHEAQIEQFDLEQVERFKRAVATGRYGSGSGVEQNYDLHTPSGFSLALLSGGAHLLLAPFPWQLAGGGTLGKLASAPELVGWWWLFFG